jgi:hypothetical protein
LFAAGPRDGAAVLPMAAAPMAVVRDPGVPLIGEVMPLPPLPALSGPPALPEMSNTSMVVRPRRLTWLAVLITSVLFAIVHPLWTAPLIFLLAVCLSYAYERTGSLWVPIIMHAMFNTSSTLVFLNFT